MFLRRKEVLTPGVPPLPQAAVHEAPLAIRRVNSRPVRAICHWSNLH